MLLPSMIACFKKVYSIYKKIRYRLHHILHSVSKFRRVIKLFAKERKKERKKEEKHRGKHFDENNILDICM